MGKWEARNSFDFLHCVYRQDDRMVARFIDRHEDALLIAAAPEMLELLLRISAKEAFIGLPDSLQEEVFAVIAKASGEEELS